MRQRMDRLGFSIVVAAGFAALLTVLGCASIDVVDRDRYQGPKLPRPHRIIVHDFAATPTDMPEWYKKEASFGKMDVRPTAAEIEAGKALGVQVAEELVDMIADMGLPGLRAEGQPAPHEGDLVLVGYFGSIDEGSAFKRVVIGFGSGAPELKTHVEGYTMTDQGLKRLGSGDLSSDGGKVPGVILPTIVTIATANPIGLIVGGTVKGAGEMFGKSAIEKTAEDTAKKIAEVLEERFEEEGWL